MAGTKVVVGVLEPVESTVQGDTTDRVRLYRTETSMRKFLVNDPRVPKFVSDSVGSTDTQCYGSVALEVDGQIKAAGLFDNYSGTNAFLHFSVAPKVGIPRDLLRLVFTFAFKELGLKRLSAAFPKARKDVCRLGQLCGFRFEAVLKGAASDGGDLMIHRLLPGDCQFIV